MYLLELNKPGYGSEISVGQGFATFFRMSLGAVASGLVFGLGTLGIMWLLKRRLNREENVVEVSFLPTDQSTEKTGTLTENVRMLCSTDRHYSYFCVPCVFYD